MSLGSGLSWLYCMRVCSQGVWLCHRGHVDAEYADPSSSKSSLWVCYHGPDLPGACGGMPSVCMCGSEVVWNINVLLVQIHFFCQLHGYIYVKSVYYSTGRVCHILHVTASGPNGLRRLKEVDWQQQHSVVRCLSIIWIHKLYKHSNIINRIYIQSWSELLAPLVNMIKEGSENKPALLILLIFIKKNHKNLTFHWIIIIKNGWNIIKIFFFSNTRWTQLLAHRNSYD